MPDRERSSEGRSLGYAFGSIAAIVVAMIFLFPFYWALSTSLRNPADTFTVAGLGIPWVDFAPTFANWAQQLATAEARQALANSTMIAVGASVLALLLDTQLALILINATFVLPFVVVIVRQTFIELPLELEEAALADGAGHFGAFWRIALPLAMPAIVATGLIIFAFAWNEFLFAITIASREAITIPVLMAGAVDTRGVQFWFMAGGARIALIPPGVVGLVGQGF